MWNRFLSSFDALGWAVLIGSLLFLGGLVWVLVANRPVERVERIERRRRGDRAPADAPVDRPRRPRRAA